MIDPHELGWRGDPGEIVAAVLDDPLARLVARIRRAQPKWFTRAGCIDQPTDVFFPIRGQNATAALAICQRCPVLEQCHDWALEQPTPDVGVVGGMTPKERADARRLRKEQR